MDVPIDITTAEVLPHELQRDRLEELLTRFEFGTLLDRLGQLFPRLREAGQDEAGARLAAPAAPPQDAQAWQSLFDWSRPVGMVAEDTSALPGTLEPAAGFPVRVWLAQGPAGQGSEAYGAVISVPVLDPAEAAPVIRPLLEQGGAVCHDLKSSPALQTLIEQAGHDTYVAAYLLAPSRREYPLGELAREAGLRAPECVSPGERARPRRPWRSRWPSGRRRSCASRACGICSSDIELPLTAVLIDMEEVGIHLDCYRLGEITGKIQDQMEELETRIYELAGEQFNLGSPQQLGRMLFERLGLPRQRKTKTGYSTDAKTLEALRDSHPIVGDISQPPRALQAHVHLPAGAAAGRRPGHRTAAHHLQPDGRGHRPALLERSRTCRTSPCAPRWGRRSRQCFTAGAGQRCWSSPTTRR